MKHLITCILLLISCCGLHAQNDKVIYAELLGNGFIIGSVNYDQRLMNEHDGLGIRVGVGIVDPGFGQYTFPVLVNYLIGSEKHQLELGAGMVYPTKLIDLGGSTTIEGISYTFSVMYRLNGLDSGINFRIGWTPIFNKLSSAPYWPGVSIGYRL